MSTALLPEGATRSTGTPPTLPDSSPAIVVGRVLAVTGTRIAARLLTEAEGFQAQIVVEGERQTVGQLGTYVAIRQFGMTVLALVNDLTFPPDAVHRAPNNSAGAVMQLTPIGELSEKGSFQRGVRRFPTLGAEVHAVGRSEITAIFAKNQPYRFNVGYLRNYPGVGVYLNPSALCGRHFAILGQSGSGKSWTVANLIQRMIATMPRAHVVLLDLHGEYCWPDENGNLQSAFAPEHTRYLDARELEIPYWLMTYAELVDLLIDRSDASASIQTAFFRDTIFSLKKKSAARLGLNNVSIDSPVYFSLAEVYKHFKEANELRGDFGKTKGALFGQFDEFLVKLQSRLNDVRYDFLLRPKHRDKSESMVDLLRDFVGLGEPKRPITVINLSHVPFDVRPTVSAQIGRIAFEFNYWNPRYREFPLLLICEEAHAYIPREDNGQFEGTRRSMERIAKEGRKYGVSLGVVSQRPHELSETVLSQCGTYICLRVTNPADQQYIRHLVPEGEGDLIDVLSALGRGEAMILGEAIPLPIRCQSFKPDPTPNSNDVDYHLHWREGPEDLNVDEIVDRWRRQGRMQPADPET